VCPSKLCLGGPTGLDASLRLEEYLTALPFARSTATWFLPGPLRRWHNEILVRAVGEAQVASRGERLDAALRVSEG